MAQQLVQMHLTVHNLIIKSGGKTGWGYGDILGQIQFYNDDGSGIGARDAVFIKATNLQGNGSSTTTFDGNLEIWTSAYNSAATKCATFGASNNVIGEAAIVCGTGTVSNDIDTRTNVGFAQPRGAVFQSSINGDYFRDLIQHNTSAKYCDWSRWDKFNCRYTSYYWFKW